MIDSIRWVDYTHAEQTTTQDVLTRLRPRYFAKGADWRFLNELKSELKG